MSEINLLPEELRGEEAKNLPGSSAGRSGDFSFHLPSSDGLKPKIQPAVFKDSPDIPVKAPGQISKPSLTFSPAEEKIFKEVEQQLQPLPKPLPAAPVVNSPAVKISLAGKPLDAVAQPSGPLPVQKPLQPGKEKAGFFNKLFGKKAPQGRIIKNAPDKGAKGHLPIKALDVNLIPEGLDLLPNQKIYHYFILAGLFGLLAVGLIFLGLIIYGQVLAKQEQSLTNQLGASEVKYNQLKSKEEVISGWYQKVASIKQLFLKHLYWTNFFSSLEKITIPQVYYKEVKAAQDSNVVLDAVAENFLALARQYLAFQQAKDVVKAVTISGIASDILTGEVSFSVILKFAPEIYLEKTNN